MNILDLLAQRAPEINSEIESIMPRDEKPEMIYSLVWDFLDRGGKRFRPLLTLLCCRAVGNDYDGIMKAAVAFELFHNFTLVHDDIEDDSLKRRGKPCLHITYGLPLAINAGDGLFVYVWKAIEDAHIPQEKLQRSIKIYNTAFKSVLDGQGWEIGWFTHNIWDLTEKDYLMMVKGKTGALIAGACELGAYLGDGSEQQIEILKDFGLAVGIAFQIQDDILDITGDNTKFQKVICGDITEGKRTLIVIHTLEKCTPEEREFLIKTLDDHTRDEEKIKKVVELFKKYDSIVYAKEFAKEIINKEKEKIIKELKDSDAKEKLISLGDFFLNREF